MLTKPELALIQALPAGRDNAITANEIGGRMLQHLGYWPSERTVRKIASGLRRKGHVIASSPGKPSGFYKPVSRAEALECREELARRLREMRRTVAAFDRAVEYTRVAEAVGQVRLPGIDIRA